MLTTDWKTCPPCPEGVEAGWCADSDEILDFDCGDQGMEDDPRCLNGDRHPFYPNPNVKECKDLNKKPPPPCDENTKSGELCRDEGDTDTCDGPAYDIGNGCELPPVDPEDPLVFPDDSVEYPVDEEEYEEDNDSDNGNSDNDNGNSDNGDSDNESDHSGESEGEDSDNGDSGSGEFFD
jgi:hypothetical protein